MPIWRLQCTFAHASALPRDRVVLTPHFDDAGALSDPQGLCDDLAAAMQTWWSASATGEIRVQAYDAQGTAPVFPQGDAILRAGTFSGSNEPRELAVCLSFYNERNSPRRRGRLYVPGFMAAVTVANMRPLEAVMQKVADLVPVFTALGGADVDWVVYSRADNVARPVTNWFVDDEWDVVRSRGLRPTTRLAGTTSEG